MRLCISHLVISLRYTSTVHFSNINWPNNYKHTISVMILNYSHFKLIYTIIFEIKSIMDKQNYVENKTK